MGRNKAVVIRVGGHRQAVLQGQESSTATMIAASLAAKAGLTGWGDGLGGFRPEAIWGCVGHDGEETASHQDSCGGHGLILSFRREDDAESTYGDQRLSHGQQRVGRSKRAHCLDP